MEVEQRGISLAIEDNQDTENRENCSAKRTSKMKTIPQFINQVRPPLELGQPENDNNSKKSSRLTFRPTNMTTKSPASGRTIKKLTKRRGLATLQQSASSKNSVVGALRNDAVFGGGLKQKKIEIFTEESPKVERQPPPKSGDATHSATQLVALRKVATATIETQTDFEEWLPLEDTRKPDQLAEEALALMRSEPSQEQYFKEIAEQRRLALEETLQENEELYDEIDTLKQKCTDLETALSEAENYKLLYNTLMKEKREDN
eukprot:Seg852.7 transcript_id=Seg852.7/GoldUCD/mRNA.D3Y31 product=Geminin protein_id=Seg852.7/GoldUCD/D3Y31